MAYLSDEFIDWLEANAEEIDQKSGTLADQLLEKIAAEGVFKVGLPESLGGDGADKTEVVNFLAELAQHSLTASFIGWGQRTFIETILASGNHYLIDNWLDDLITGKLSAGTGLSNATKFLSQIEDLNVTIIEKDGKRYLRGRLPWVTNLRSDNFTASFVAGYKDGDKKPIALVIPSTAEGLTRSEDLQFVSLQGGNTASLTFNNVELDERWILSEDAIAFLSDIRPEFLGYQFGLAFGLAERSLDEVEKDLATNRSVLGEEWQATLDSLEAIRKPLFEGLNKPGYFIENPRQLFQLRIDIVGVVANALLLELQAGGGRAYFKHSSSSFTRRWNEGAFLPIVSPSAVQLRHILAESA
ncbi:acyl-CoA dehydrogenase family protein [Streptococcus loxodontisalivarius]|uniref:Alkylation response protein AidB-like acyl-CoA dehydrogenase n=1 Tax=Streptococcus loxodontisalivarius TaxID=1349415 RepID=A0ABS2PSA7_9STRE|nr:acyl-CoA dehydrogenase family protein [Streptococcus loxodontisalivarius]MBM7642928.1 alkylation response protein AidB-like acyl-CoA dehydrogenase [Streptococcus loxodontisalivarius]